MPISPIDAEQLFLDSFPEAKPTISSSSSCSKVIPGQRVGKVFIQ